VWTRSRASDPPPLSPRPGHAATPWRLRSPSARATNGSASATIARSERGLWRLYLGDPEYGSLGYDGHHDWAILEGRYTLAILFEYAATLGLLDVDYSGGCGSRRRAARARTW
jgi:hypothetical protein